MKDDIASHLSTHFFDYTKFEVWLFLYEELCFKKGALSYARWILKNSLSFFCLHGWFLGFINELKFFDGLML
jgi:hypothetical protein